MERDSYLVLDETKAIHQLDLGDLASSMGIEMGLNIALGRCCASVGSGGSGAKFAHRAKPIRLDPVASTDHFVADCPDTT